MTSTQNKKIGLFGTLLIHLLIIAYMLYFGFTKKESLEMEGLTVNFGTIDEAAGLFEPEEAFTPLESTPPPIDIKTPDKEIITQNQEASISLADKKKKEAESLIKKEADQKRIQQERLRSEQSQKTALIKNQTANAFGKSNGKSLSQGTAQSGTGNQGDPNGDPNSTNSKGGGSGYGKFSLNGRSLNGGLPRPTYAIQEEGVVVVQIAVNPKGIVTATSIALQGTNTDNATLRSAALSAARQARFNIIEGSQNQSGTITYRFILK
jgi:TonB family protein